MKRLLLVPPLLAILSLPAIGQDQGMMQMHMKQGASMSEADKGYLQAMQSMHGSMMGMEMTGDPDGDFVRMMIPHHQSAVDMAEVLLQQKDVDPKIRKMAESIKSSQVREIEEMKTWLAEHPE